VPENSLRSGLVGAALNSADTQRRSLEHRSGPVQVLERYYYLPGRLLTLTNGALRATSEVSSWTAARLYRVLRPQRVHSPGLAWT
jgi:hypothetical protein